MISNSSRWFLKYAVISCGMCTTGAHSQGIIRVDENAFTAQAGLITFSEFAVGMENPFYLPAAYGGGVGAPTVSFGGYFMGQSPGSSDPSQAPVGAALSGVVLGSPSGPLALDPTSPATFIVGDGSNPTSPVLSGSPQFNGAVTILFGSELVGVGLDGGFFDAVGGTAIIAFARDGSLIGSVLNEETGIEFLGLVTGDGLARIAGLQFALVGPEPAGFAIDNLRFGQAGQVVVPGAPGLASLPFLLATRQVETLAVRSGYEDINSRLFRLRSGYRSQGTGSQEVSPQAASHDPKGGIPSAPTITSQAWEVFGSISHERSDFARNAVAVGTVALNLPGYDVDLTHGTAGVEYDFDNNLSAGAAFIATEGDVDFNNGSSYDLDRSGFAIYGSYFRENTLPNAALYSDLLYGYSEGDYDTSRNTPGGAFRGNTDSATHLLEFNSGLVYTHGSLSHGPTVGLAWQTGEIDGYTEQGVGGLNYPSTDVDSLTSSLGYQASYRIPITQGELILQGRVAWEHQLEDQDLNFAGNSIGGVVDDDAAVLGTGILWQFHQNAYAVLDYQSRLSGDIDHHNLTLRVGYTF